MSNPRGWWIDFSTEILLYNNIYPPTGSGKGAAASPRKPRYTLTVPPFAEPMSQPASEFESQSEARSTLEREVLKQFRVILQSVRKHFQEVEQACGVSGAQLWALSCIAATPGMRPSELAKAMTIHQSTASNLVEKLVELGYVARARHRQDLRSVTLSLTPLGESALARAPGPFQGLLPDALSQAPGEVLEPLHQHLSVLLGLMQRVEPQATHKPLSDL